MEKPERQKRPRSSNFSPREMNVLVDGVIQHKAILLSRVQEFSMHRRKFTVWNRILYHVNAVGDGVERKNKEIRVKWARLVCNTRRKVAVWETAMAEAKSSGDPTKTIPLELNILEEKINNYILPYEASLDARQPSIMIENDPSKIDDFSCYTVTGRDDSPIISLKVEDDEAEAAEIIRAACDHNHPTVAVLQDDGSNSQLQFSSANSLVFGSSLSLAAVNPAASTASTGGDVGGLAGGAICIDVDSEPDAKRRHTRTYSEASEDNQLLRLEQERLEIERQKLAAQQDIATSLKKLVSILESKNYL